MQHTIGLWLYYNSPSIQAVAALLALLGLGLYTLETWRIRRATLAQGDASRRSYFQARDWKNEPSSGFGKTFYLEFLNCGSGIALDVRWRFLHKNEMTPVVIGSCAVGMVKFLFSENQEWITYEAIREMGGVRLEYSDTSGRRYWSTVTLLNMKGDSIHYSIDTGDGH